MSVKGMRRLSNVLMAVGGLGLIFTAIACGAESLKMIIILGLIGLGITAGGLIGGQLLSNEADYREYQQKELKTYRRLRNAR